MSIAALKVSARNTTVSGSTLLTFNGSLEIPLITVTGGASLIVLPTGLHGNTTLATQRMASDGDRGGSAAIMTKVRLGRTLLILDHLRVSIHGSLSSIETNVIVMTGSVLEAHLPLTFRSLLVGHFAIVRGKSLEITVRTNMTIWEQFKNDRLSIEASSTL